MKRTLIVFACGLLATTAFAQELAGVWTLTIDTPRGVQHPVLTINESGDGYSGTYEGQRGLLPIERVARDGNRFEFPLTISIPIGDIEVRYSGSVEGEQMRGVVANPRGEVPFTGVRQ